MTALTFAAVDVEKLVQNAEKAATVTAAAKGHESVLEPKFDGWRVVAIVGDDGKLRTFTRSGQELTGKMPAVEACLAEAFPPGSILDGEVVAFEVVNGVPVPRWNKVQSVLGSDTAKAALMSVSLTYVVFDLLAHGGHDARPLDLKRRRALLNMIFANHDFPPSVQLSPQLPVEEETHAVLLAQGYEGSIVKWLDAPYRSGVRGQGFFKLKGTARIDAIVVGYEEGKGGFAGLVGALRFGQYDTNGVLVDRGSCSGMSMELRETISADRDAYLGAVIEIQHMGLQEPTKANPHGSFRHPQFKRLRLDKAPESVTLHD